MNENEFCLTANLVDIAGERIFPAEIAVASGRIADIHPTSAAPTTFVAPGFVDAHVHIESSLLVPAEFARAAVVHGTVATVSDPHEIANVLGVEGVRYMLDNAAHTPLKILFGAPSCVPATAFETSGSRLSVADVARLLDDVRIGYLSEMMNVRGVLHGDADVLAKIGAAIERGKPVDGHAPQVYGDDARNYFAAGISTDHECMALDEAREKLALGVKILIREGSAARNFAALAPLLAEHSDRCMFCSDDLHPDALVEGHIDRLVRRAVAQGYDVMKVLRCACANPVEHYSLPVGQLRVGDAADFIELDNLTNFGVLRTFIDGRIVAERGKPRLTSVPAKAINHFERERVQPSDFHVAATSKQVRAIEAFDGELITRNLVVTPRVEGEAAVADPHRDLLKIAVVNRYRSVPPAIAFVKGFGLARGAIASSVAHDSHNIVAVGADDASLATAVNLITDTGGGLAIVDGDAQDALPLPVAGLMSNEPYENIAAAYTRLDRTTKSLGSPLRAPFMTLSFMALLVIPELKLSDRGLFDSRKWEFTSLFLQQV